MLSNIYYCLIYTTMNEYISVTKYNIDWQDWFTGKINISINISEPDPDACGSDWKADRNPNTVKPWKLKSFHNYTGTLL